MKTSNKLLTSAAAVICTLILAGIIYAKKNIQVQHENLNTEQKTSQRKLETFHGINVIGNYDIKINKGEPGIKITTDEATLENLEIKVVDGILIVTRKENSVIRFHDSSIDLEISTSALESIESTGNSDIEMLNDNLVDQFEIKQIGNGTIQSKTESKSIEVNLTGNGDIRNTGRTEHLEIKMLGNGDLDFSKTEASTIDVSLTGNGDCVVLSNGKIKGSLLGNGDLHYKGTAQVEVSKTGNGEVLKDE